MKNYMNILIYISSNFLVIEVYFFYMFPERGAITRCFSSIGRLQYDVAQLESTESSSVDSFGATSYYNLLTELKTSEDYIVSETCNKQIFTTRKFTRYKLKYCYNITSNRYKLHMHMP